MAPFAWQSNKSYSFLRHPKPCLRVSIRHGWAEAEFLQQFLCLRSGSRCHIPSLVFLGLPVPMCSLLGAPCFHALSWPEKICFWQTQVSLSSSGLLFWVSHGLDVSWVPLWTSPLPFREVVWEMPLWPLIPAAFLHPSTRGLCALDEKVIVGPVDSFFVFCFPNPKCIDLIYSSQGLKQRLKIKQQKQWIGRLGLTYIC